MMTICFASRVVKIGLQGVPSSVCGQATDAALGPFPLLDVSTITDSNSFNFGWNIDQESLGTYVVKPTYRRVN
jgi:hypothetical protein